MNSRERFLKACQMEILDRPPVWVMRQAGRYLPEYRALKDKYSFLEMVKTPELASEVTLQPMQRFQLDAAIIFSDILVVPEAMGMPYSFRDEGGIEMSGCIESTKDVKALSNEGLPEKLNYVTQALKMTRRQLGGEKALLGFGGSPWTVATYMIEGGSTRTFNKSKLFMKNSPKLFHQLLEKITQATIDYFNLQIKAGVDAVQIFDSWGGALTQDTFWEGSAQYLKEIVMGINEAVPIIVFSKGAHHWNRDLIRTRANVLAVDSTTSIARFHDMLEGKFAVQGNLDPELMSTTPEKVRKETLKILHEFGERKGLIFNLGHGIRPEGKIECMEAMVETVVNYRHNKALQSVEEDD